MDTGQKSKKKIWLTATTTATAGCTLANKTKETTENVKQEDHDQGCALR
jgi:hypothetical protein